MSAKAMELIGKLPESMQEGVMEVGMHAMRDPHVASAAMLPAALALAYVPHFFKGAVILAKKGKYNLEEPRAMRGDDRFGFQDGGGLGALLRRCEGCHQNALEGFGPFAASVLAAKVFLVDDKAGARKAAALAMRYLLARLVYTLAYICGVHRAIAVVRALAFGDGLGSVFKLFMLALKG